MEPFEDSEDQDVEELAQKFRDAADAGTAVYYDSLDIQDVIAFFIDTGELHYAEKALNYATRTFPKDPYIRLLRSKFYTSQSKFTEAERELDYVESHFAPFPELYIEKVILARINNKQINAIELLKKSLSLDGDIPEIHLLLAHEYIRSDEIDQAVSSALRAIQLDPYAADDLKNLFLSFQTEEDRRLVDFFKVLTEEMPLNPSLWNGLGLAYLCAGDYPNANDAFQFQLSIDDNDPMAYANIAEAYFAMSDYPRAIEYFTKAADNCEVMQFNYPLGTCYYELKDFDKALRFFLKAYEEDPVYAWYVSHDIVRVLNVQGRYDEARKFLRGHLQKSPQDVVATEDLIDLLDPGCDTDEILELCYTVLHDAADSECCDFFYFIVSYCYYNHCTDIGLKLLENFRDAPYLQQSICYQLALLLFRSGQVERGCEQLELALQTDSQRLKDDFLDIDPSLRDLPEVARLVERYAPDSLSDTQSSL